MPARTTIPETRVSGPAARKKSVSGETAPESVAPGKPGSGEPDPEKLALEKPGPKRSGRNRPVRRMYVAIPAGLAERLERAADRPSVTRDDLVEAALAAFLDPETAGDGRDGLILRRLDRLDARCHMLDRDLVIANETLALFVRFFLTVVPPLPVDERDAARALGQKRFEHFLEQLGRRLAGGRNLLREVVGAFAAGIGPEDRLATLDAGAAPAPDPAPATDSAAADLVAADLAATRGSAIAAGSAAAAGLTVAADSAATGPAAAPRSGAGE